MKLKEAVSTLISMYFGSPQLGHKIKANLMEIQTVDRQMCSILIYLKKGLGAWPTKYSRPYWEQFLRHILNIILQNNTSHVIFY